MPMTGRPALSLSKSPVLSLSKSLALSLSKCAELAEVTVRLWGKEGVHIPRRLQGHGDHLRPDGARFPSPFLHQVGRAEDDRPRRL
jgi:hypothetical protein